MSAPRKYATEEERLKAYKEQQNNYSKKKWFCGICNRTFNLGNKTNHLRSKKHINNANSAEN